MASRASVIRLRFLRPRRGRKNACWGCSRHFWTKCPEVMVASPAISRLFLIPAGGRNPKQMVDDRLDSQDLPHIPLGRVVLGIEVFFLRRMLNVTL